MDTNDDAPEGVEENGAAAQALTGEGQDADPVCASSGNRSFEQHNYHDHVVDRTGEVMSAAFMAAEHHIRAGAVLVRDPITDVEVPFVQARGNLTPISADAFADYRSAPVRVRGTAKHTRLDSFIAHVNRFKNINTSIFALDSGDKPSVNAVFDYHAETDFQSGLDIEPDFAQHRSSYDFPLSEEWKSWHKADGEKMDMGEFAAFLEDRIVDVEAITDYSSVNDTVKQFVNTLGGWGTVASPSKLIELSRGLQIYENSVVKDVRKLSSGEAQIAFSSEHVDADGKPLNIPTLFIINIPVFARSTVLDRVVVRLRYRKGASVQFWFELWRTDRVFDFAFDEALQTIRDQTELPVFVGTDEGAQTATTSSIPDAPAF